MHALSQDIEKYKGKYDAGYAPTLKQRFEKLRQLGLIDSDLRMSQQSDDWEKVKDSLGSSQYGGVRSDDRPHGPGHRSHRRRIAETKPSGQRADSLVIRDGDWKLVRYGETGKPARLRDWELYNIRTDRSEQENLKKEFPDKVRELEEKWNSWAVRANVKPWPYK